MKKGLAIILGMGLIATLVVGCVGCAGNVAAADSDTSGVILTSNQNTGIWVSGTGTMTLAPDLLGLNLGVLVEEKTVAAAQSLAQETMQKVIAALVGGGVKEEDIQTTKFTIEPVYQWTDNGFRFLVGYRVTNMVQVKIHDLTNAGQIIDSAVAAGGDYVVVNGVWFTVDGIETYQSELRELAMSDAKAKAEQLANLSGVTLGKPTYISETSVGGGIPIYKDIAGQIGATPILAGEMEISLSVQVVYSIE